MVLDSWRKKRKIRKEQRKDLAVMGFGYKEEDPIFLEIPNPIRYPDGRFAPKGYTWADFERDKKKMEEGEKRRKPRRAQ